MIPYDKANCVWVDKSGDIKQNRVGFLEPTKHNEMTRAKENKDAEHSEEWIENIKEKEKPKMSYEKMPHGNLLREINCLMGKRVNAKSYCVFWSERIVIQPPAGSAWSAFNGRGIGDLYLFASNGSSCSQRRWKKTHDCKAPYTRNQTRQGDERRGNYSNTQLTHACLVAAILHRSSPRNRYLACMFLLLWTILKAGDQRGTSH